VENKARYVLVGIFVLLSLIAAIIFFAWLSDAQFDRQYDNYQVKFDGPVRGLSEGSEVRLNGILVGEVTGLQLDRTKPNNVTVDIRVHSGTPVFNNSKAKLEPQGLTGLSYLQIFPGDVSAGDMPEMGEHTIRGEMSQLDSIFDESTSIIEGTQEALGRVNAALSEEAISDFQGILDNTNQITANLRDMDIDGELVNRALIAIEKAANDIASAARAIETSAVEFDTFVSEDLVEFINRTTMSLDNVDTMLAEVTEFAEGGTDLTVDARDAINRLSNSSLTDLEETADGLRRLVAALTAVAEQLERNPAQFIAGEELETMELPQ